MSARVEGMGEVTTVYEKKFQVTTEWCLAINNIDYVRQSLQPFVEELGMVDIITRLGELRSPMEAQRYDSCTIHSFNECWQFLLSNDDRTLEIPSHSFIGECLNYWDWHYYRELFQRPFSKYKFKSFSLHPISTYLQSPFPSLPNNTSSPFYDISLEIFIDNNDNVVLYYRCKETLENVVENAIDTVRNKIIELLEKVVRKVSKIYQYFMSFVTAWVK